MVQALLERNSPRNVNDAWKTIKCAIRQDPTILNNGQLDNGKQCFQKFVRNNRKRRHSTYINFKNHKKKINTNLAKRSSQNDPRFDAIVDFIIKNKMFSDNFTYVPIVFAKVTNNGDNVNNGSSETYTQKMLPEKNLTTANGMNASSPTIKDMESSTNSVTVNNMTSSHVDYSAVTKAPTNISNIFRREDNTLQPSSGMNDTDLVIPEPEQNPLELGIPEEDAVVEQYDDTSTDLSQNGTQIKDVTVKINTTTPNSITSSQNSNRKKKNVSEIVLEPIQTDKAVRPINYEAEYLTDAGEVPITFALNDTNVLYNATATSQFTTLRNFIANETCQTEQAISETTENNFIKPVQNTTNLSILQSNNNKVLQSKNNGTNVHKTVTEIDLCSDSYSTTVLNNESSIIENVEQNCTHNYSIDLMNSTTINATIFENKNQTVGPVNLLKETLIKGGITNDNFSSLNRSVAENATQYSFINESTRSISSSITVKLTAAVNISENLCITSNGNITTIGVGATSESFINNNIALTGSSPNDIKSININPVTETSTNGTNNFTQNIEFTGIKNTTSNNFTNESNSTTNKSTNVCITVSSKYGTSLNVETRSDNETLVEGTTTNLNLTVSNLTGNNTTSNITVMFDSMESTTINTTTLKYGNIGARYSSSNGDFSNNGTKSDYVILTTESITNENLTVNYSVLPSKLYKEQDMLPGVLIYRKEQEENKNIAKTKRDVYDIVEPELFDFNIQSNIGITIEEPSDVNNNKYVDFNPLIKQKKSIVPFNCSDETMKMLDTLHQLNLSNFEEETTETIHLTTITETSPLPNYDQVQKLTDVDAGIGKDVDSSLLQDSNQTFSEYQIPQSQVNQSLVTLSNVESTLSISLQTSGIDTVVSNETSININPNDLLELGQPEEDLNIVSNEKLGIKGSNISGNINVNLLEPNNVTTLLISVPVNETSVTIPLSNNFSPYSLDTSQPSNVTSYLIPMNCTPLPMNFTLASTVPVESTVPSLTLEMQTNNNTNNLSSSSTLSSITVVQNTGYSSIAGNVNISFSSINPLVLNSTSNQTSAITSEEATLLNIGNIVDASANHTSTMKPLTPVSMFTELQPNLNSSMIINSTSTHAKRNLESDRLEVLEKDLQLVNELQNILDGIYSSNRKRKKRELPIYFEQIPLTQNVAFSETEIPQISNEWNEKDLENNREPKTIIIRKKRHPRSLRHLKRKKKYKVFQKSNPHGRFLGQSLQNST
ncbi:uncharacterized protein [Diabrotica undecimpunctata]